MRVRREPTGSGIVARLRSGRGLTLRAALNAFASSLDFGARAVVGFLVNPLLVSALGNTLFGVWEVLWRLTDYMWAASGRSAQALKWAIAHRQRSEDYEEKRRFVGSTMAIWFLFLPAVLLLGGLLAWAIPLLLEVSTNHLWAVRLAIFLLLGNVIVLSLADIPRAVLQGENLGYKRMGLSALLIFVGGGLTALALYLDLGLPGVATATLVQTGLTGAAFLFIVRSHVPWFGFARPSLRIIRWFLGLSWWFILWKFIMQLTMAGDFLVLGIFDSVELVTSYSLTKYVPDTVLRLVAIVVSGVAPGLGGIIGAREHDRAARVRADIMAFSWLLGTTVGCTILLWNPSFLSLWVGTGYDAGSLPTLLIAVMVLQLTLIRNDANVIDLTLDIRRKVLLGLLSVTVSVSLAALLVGVFDRGVVGLCVGFISGRILLTCAYPWLVGQVLGLPWLQQLRSVWRPALTSGLLFFAAYAGRSAVGVESWLGLVPAVAGTAVLVAALALVFGLTTGQRLSLWDRLQALGAEIRSG